MIYVIKTIYIFILSISMTSQSSFQDIRPEIEDHLSQFSEFQVSHHDNIDDDSHGHTHKHSEDGEEHEHHHDHGKTSAPEDRIVFKVVMKSPLTNYLFKEAINFEKFLVSNPHPFAIFRPPIA